MEKREINKRLGSIDSKLLKLIDERVELALLLNKFSTDEPDYEESSERRKLSAVAPKFVEALFKRLERERRQIGRRGVNIVGFQGEHGAYGESAAKQWDSQSITLPCRSFAEVFEGVAAGILDYGVVPVENNLGGIVGEVNNLLMQNSLSVIHAIEMQISHCLLIRKGSSHRDLKKVISHPQALSQCREFLKRHKYEPIPHKDTAGAAMIVAEESSGECAAIAGKLTAELYNLAILKENIQDLDRNRTRFLVLSKKPLPKGRGEKCSIVFSTPHKAGALYRVLKEFAEAGINLTRLESVPGIKSGDHDFFLDFAGSDGDANVITLLKRLVSEGTNIKMLGCYKEEQI